MSTQQQYIALMPKLKATLAKIDSKTHTEEDIRFVEYTQSLLYICIIEEIDAGNIPTKIDVAAVEREMQQAITRQK